MWREENSVLQAMRCEEEGRVASDKRMEAMFFAGVLP
jgi:hypothetical protein